MDHDRLLHLIDHPTPDADAPRNPVLKHQVMERVRHVAATSRTERIDRRPWAMGTAMVVLIGLAAPFTGLVQDGGLGEAANLFDADLMLELVVGAVIAAAGLALAWRKFV